MSLEFQLSSGLDFVHFYQNLVFYLVDVYCVARPFHKRKELVFNGPFKLDVETWSSSHLDPPEASLLRCHLFLVIHNVVEQEGGQRHVFK